MTENQSKGNEKDGEIRSIIDEHLKQNAHSHVTLGLLYKYCKIKKCQEYSGNNLFDYLETGFNQHFPKMHSEQFSIYSDACLEFLQHDKLLALLEKSNSMTQLSEDGEFIAQIIDLAYDFYRDVDAGISIAENYLIRNQSQSVEESLLKLYVSKKDHSKASQLLPKLKGLISEEDFIQKEASILEIRGLNQDAIDKIRTIPNRLGFEENHGAHISYLYLKMNEYEKAKNECRTVLDKHNFAQAFEVEIINYEFARFKLKNKADRNRLNPIANSNVNDGAKAVALLMLEDEEKAFKILKNECGKKFSNIDSYLEWPVLELLKPRLVELKADLIKNRRNIAGNSIFKKHNVISI